MAQGFPSIPGFSSWSDFSGLLQAQNRLLEQLPATLMRLTEVLEKIAPAANDAVETVNSSRRVTARVEALVDELEKPIRDLIPAIEKLTAVLNDPAIAAIPTTLQRVQDEVHPVLDRMSSLRHAATHTGRRARHVVDAVADLARRTQRGSRD